MTMEFAGNANLYLAAGGESPMERAGAQIDPAEVVNWMLRRGRHMTHMREFGDEMCRRIVAAGIPIWRAFCSVRTLHPQVVASAYIWHRDEAGAVRLTAPHEFTQSEEYSTSPIAEIKRSGRT